MKAKLIQRVQRTGDREFTASIEVFDDEQTLFIKKEYEYTGANLAYAAYKSLQSVLFDLAAAHVTEVRVISDVPFVGRELVMSVDDDIGNLARYTLLNYEQSNIKIKK